MASLTAITGKFNIPSAAIAAHGIAVIAGFVPHGEEQILHDAVAAESRNFNERALIGTVALLFPVLLSVIALFQSLPHSVAAARITAIVGAPIVIIAIAVVTLLIWPLTDAVTAPCEPASIRTPVVIDGIFIITLLSGLHDPVPAHSLAAGAGDSA